MNEPLLLFAISIGMGWRVCMIAIASVQDVLVAKKHAAIRAALHSATETAAHKSASIIKKRPTKVTIQHVLVLSAYCTPTDARLCLDAALAARTHAIAHKSSAKQPPILIVLNKASLPTVRTVNDYINNVHATPTHAASKRVVATTHLGRPGTKSRPKQISDFTLIQKRRHTNIAELLISLRPKISGTMIIVTDHTSAVPANIYTSVTDYTKTNTLQSGMLFGRAAQLPMPIVGTLDVLLQSSRQMAQSALGSRLVAGYSSLDRYSYGVLLPKNTTTAKKVHPSLAAAAELPALPIRLSYVASNGMQGFVHKVSQVLPTSKQARALIAFDRASLLVGSSYATWLALTFRSATPLLLIALTATGWLAHLIWITPAPLKQKLVRCYTIPTLMAALPFVGGLQIAGLVMSELKTRQAAK